MVTKIVEQDSDDHQIKQALQALHRQLTEQNLHIQALSVQNTQREQAISALTSQLVERNHQIEHLEQRVADLEAQLAEKNSLIQALLNGRAMRVMRAVHDRLHRSK